MVDLQQKPATKVATKEQLRLAEILTQGGGRDTANIGEDAASQKSVKKVQELTRCSYSEAEVALIDSQGDVQNAVALLLDNRQDLVLWSHTGKTKKSKSTSQTTNTSNTASPTKTAAAHVRRGESQRGSRFRRDGTEQDQSSGDGKQSNFQQQGRPKRAMSSKDQNGHSDRAKSQEGFTSKSQPRGGGGTGTGPRRYGGGKPGGGERDTGRSRDNQQQSGTESGGWGLNGGWKSGGGNTQQDSWKETGTWGDTAAGGTTDPFPTIGTYTAESTAKGMAEKDDEWKNGPRVFMPTKANQSTAAASANVTSTSSAAVNATTSWPSLDNQNQSSAMPSSTMAPPDLTQPKPKTFASVAATKKAPPMPPPVQVKQQQAPPQASASANEATSSSAIGSKSSGQQVDAGSEPAVAEWSSSVDWGTATLSPPPMAPTTTTAVTDHSPVKPPQQHTEPSPAAPATVSAPETFGSSGHSLSVNQEYTDQLKSVIGLKQSAPPVQQQPVVNVPSSGVDYYQQQISQMQQQSLDGDGASEFDRKVEFATRELPPAVTSATNYQFGFQFGTVAPTAAPKENASSMHSTAASLSDAWNKQHISSVELDRSMLKNSSVNVLSTMTLPTSSAQVASAHFSTATQQNDYQQQQQQRNSSAQAAAALSFTDTASVNFPPANGSGAMGVGVQTAPQSNVISSTGQQQQQPGKPLYTAVTNSSMVAAPQQLQHHQIQQQHQQAQAALYHHQTSMAAPPTAAVPPHQFSYNMPYMYSPVAAAPQMAGNTELDRLFIQSYAAPYGNLDMQLGTMSLGQPTTMAPTHRNPLDSYNIDKFASAQQQSGNAAMQHGSMQQQQAGQQQRGPTQSDTAAMFGGSGVPPPPGFGMPTGPTQQYVPQANLHSLFQMPGMGGMQYHHPAYQQHQFMMPTAAGRMPQSQRPAQTSPPEGNGGGNGGGGHQQQQRRDQQQGGYAGPDSGEHSTGGGGRFNSYRQYM